MRVGPLTIKWEMRLICFLVVVLSSLLSGGIFLKFLYESSMESALDSLRECNSHIVTFTEGLFRENAMIIEMLSRDDVVISAGHGDREAVLDAFDSILKSNVNITYIYSGYAKEGLFIRDYVTPPGYDVARRPWYRAAMEVDGVARVVYTDAATGVWLFSQSLKLVNAAGDVVGVVCIDCSNESITRQLSTKYRYESQRSYIVDPNGTVLIHPSEDQINLLLSERMTQQTWNDVVGGRSSYAEYKRDGVTTMAYFERIRGTDFIVVTAIDAPEVKQPILQGVLFLAVLIVVLSAVLGAILGRLLTRRFARPIMALGVRITNLAAGRTDPALDLRFSNAEINGIASNIEIIVRDIARREEQLKAAEYLSLHDSMTGLYNRRFFEEELRRVDEAHSLPVSLICCDVNGLKLVNDVFGHAVGDRVISVTAACLRQNCRDGGIVARVGGDEFAMILPHTSCEEAKAIIRRINASIPPGDICGAQVSLSLGCSVKQSADKLFEDVIREADEIMYEEKVLKSLEMKRNTVANIVAAAQDEGLIRPLGADEEAILDKLGAPLGAEARDMLYESYRLRRIGQCTLVFARGTGAQVVARHHTETGYRVLSSQADYRGVAGYVLHYMEHWDGSGYPAGLSGKDIPLTSRIMAIAEAWLCDGCGEVLNRRGTWYDPELVDRLTREEAEPPKDM